MYPAVLLMYFVSAAVILLASLALLLQVSLPYNKTGKENQISFTHSQFMLLSIRTEQEEKVVKQSPYTGMDRL